jgi:tetratricopeptide (TPR) repeat protein
MNDVHASLLPVLSEELGHGPPFSAEELASVSAVTVARGEGAVAGLERLTGLKSLRVKLWSRPELPVLATTFPRLRALEFHTCELESLELVRGCEALKTVEFRWCCIQDLSPLLELPALRRVGLSGNPLTEHSYRELTAELRRRGITLLDLDKSLPEVAWRMMRKLADRGLKVSVIVDDWGKTRLFAPGKDDELSKLAVIDEAELDEILAAHPQLDTEAFMERAREVFRARLARESSERRRKQLELAAQLQTQSASGSEAEEPLRRGVELARGGEYTRALAAFEQARALTPELPTAWHNAGVVLDALGRADEAVAQLREALRLQPDSYVTHTNLAFLLGQQDPVQGIEAYQQLLQRWPEDAPGWHNLACLLRDTGAHEQAREAFQRALQLAPQQAAVHHNFGRLLQRMGRAEQAEASYQRALQLDPQMRRSVRG